MTSLPEHSTSIVERLKDRIGSAELLHSTGEQYFHGMFDRRLDTEMLELVERLSKELAEARADALRYRHLKEHHSYHYPEQYECPQPREFGIQFEWQDSTPARPSMDAVIDREIEAIREQEAEESRTLTSKATP